MGIEDGTDCGTETAGVIGAVVTGVVSVVCLLSSSVFFSVLISGLFVSFCEFIPCSVFKSGIEFVFGVGTRSVVVSGGCCND